MFFNGVIAHLRFQTKKAMEAGQLVAQSWSAQLEKELQLALGSAKLEESLKSFRAGLRSEGPEADLPSLFSEQRFDSNRSLALVGRVT